MSWLADALQKWPAVVLAQVDRFTIHYVNCAIMGCMAQLSDRRV